MEAALEDAGESVAYVTDIPAIRRPQVRAYRVQVCRCRSCGKQVRGRHPDIAADQHGASAHRLGERVKAAAHVLHYGVGIPVRRVPDVLGALTGVRVTQGAVSQDALRRAAGAVGDAYRKLRTSVRASPVVHTDDTGWRVGGEPAFLMAFQTEEATVYQIRDRHRNEEVREVVPADYAGVMVTDRGRSYDAQALFWSQAAEVPGACAALDQRGGPDQDGKRTQLRQASERPSARSDGPVEGLSPRR